MTKKQFEELGKFWIDLGKYIATAILIGRFFSDQYTLSTALWGLAVLSAFLCVVLGLWFMRFGKKEENNQTATPQTPVVTEVKKGIFHIQHAEINK